MTEDRNQNTLLNFVCYYAITRHKKATKALPSGFHFNKYLSLLNRESGGSQSRLALPHMWYRWGDEVARLHMPAQLDWSHLDPPVTRVGWRGKAPVEPEDDSMVGEMKNRIDALVEDYGPEEKLRDLIGQVYSYAPFDFQDSYRQVRDTFLDIKGSMIPTDSIDQAVLEPLLDEALSEFPHADFPLFSPVVGTFETTMKAFIGQGKVGLRFAQELSEAFWFAFCYHLRLHPSAHDHIPKITLQFWETKLPDQMNHFTGQVESLLREASLRVPALAEDNDVASLVTSARQRREEDLEFIASFKSELQDMSKFLKTNRKARLTA